MALTSSNRVSGSRGHGYGSGGGLAAIIENKAETPVFFVVTAMMVIRASEVFSGGALVLSHLLGPAWYPRFEIATGTGMGLGSEMLMTIAGRTWRGWQHEATEIASRAGLSKIQRKALLDDARRNARHSFWFMLVGAAASLYAGVMFLLTNGANGGVGPFIGDLVAVALVDALVLYLGVFREARRPDASQLAQAGIQAGMNAALDAAVMRLRDGTSTDRDHNLIADVLPPHKATQFRRSVAKQQQGRTWKTAQLREALGIGRDAGGIRDLNRQVLALAKNADNGLTKDIDGRTWLIPHATVMEIWGEEIAREQVRREGLAPARRRTDGGSFGKNSRVPSSAPDRRRQGAAVAPVSSAAADATPEMGALAPLALASAPAVMAPSPHVAGYTAGTPTLWAGQLR